MNHYTAINFSKVIPVMISGVFAYGGLAAFGSIIADYATSHLNISRDDYDLGKGNYLYSNIKIGILKSLGVFSIKVISLDNTFSLVTLTSQETIVMPNQRIINLLHFLVKNTECCLELSFHNARTENSIRNTHSPQPLIL